MNKKKMGEQFIPEPIGDEEVVFSGRIFEVVKQTMRAGESEYEIEFVRRAPGVRLIISRVDPDEGLQILLTNEYRHDQKKWDMRLPGGKVFNKSSDYKAYMDSGGDIMEASRQKAIEEAEEETGIIVKDLKYIDTEGDGATVIWDLHYYEVTEFEVGTQKTETGENIKVGWYTIDQVKQIFRSRQMSEGRSVAELRLYIDELEEAS